MKKISLFKTIDAPYYIYGLNYTQKSAGIRALHYLCHALNELGYEAYITCEITNPLLRTPRLTKRIQHRHQEVGRTPVVIYPEVISGNPLAGKIVVRWLLNQPGHLAGDKYFEDGDLIFTYSPAFLPPEMKGESLHLPTFDTTIFNNKDNPYDKKRDTVCYYANKYLAKGGQLTHHVQNATSLGQEVQLSHQEIAAILRQSKLLYIYEPTALMNEALLCGCPVCVIFTEYWKKNIGEMKFPPDIGIAIEDTPEAIAFARQTVSNYTARFDKNGNAALLQVRNFIEITQRCARELGQQVGANGTTSVPLPELPGLAQTEYSRYQAVHRSEAGIRNPAIDAENKSEKRPVFHFVISLADGGGHRLVRTLDSLAGQHHSHGRVSVISRKPLPKEFGHRTDICWLQHNQSGNANALNEIIKEGGFDWLLLLEAGDMLEEQAVATIIANIFRHPEWNIVYADEDTLDANGSSDKPFFKPDFSIDCYRSNPEAIGSAVAIKYDLLQSVSGYRSDFEGAEQYDLILRAYEKSGEQGIGHVANVLHHRNFEGGPIQDTAISASRRALQEHLARTGVAADIEDGVLPGTFRIRYRHGGEAAVSIIIPTLNGGAVLQSSVNEIVANTEYKNWELIVVDMESDDADTLAFLDYLRAFNNDAIRVISQPRSANLPALLNAGARIARQDYLLFLSDSTQPLRGDWLDEMLGYAVQPGVGVVGGKGVGQGNTISNAGYILGLDGRPAVFPDLHAPQDAAGYFGRLQLPGNPSAVAFTCMLTEKKLFDELGGFDERELAGGYSDVDYCLKVGKAGRRIVWTPFALTFQRHTTESPTEVDVDEEDDEVEEKRLWIFPGPAAQTMFDRWLDRIAFDPAYNRNLSLNIYSKKYAAKAFRIEALPPLTWGPDNHPEPCILALNGDNAGCGEYRIIAPLRAMMDAEKAYGLNTSTYLSIPELARMSPDVLVFQRPILEEQVKLVELYAHYSKAFRVYELDDLITNIQYSNQARHSFQGKDLIQRFRRALDVCDRFVVSTENLAQEYRKFKKDIRVVPNYIERARWDGFAPKRNQGRKPRVGWAGSNSHVGDLAIIADVVKALSDEVEWVFLGLCPEGVRDLVEYHSSVPIKHYPAKLASLNLDLAIAPLEDVPFNHAKSHLKLLEYGMMGYPVVCTDLTPYRGAYPVTRVKNRLKHWVDAIREHVSDPDELSKRGDALRDYTKANWILEDHLDVWLKAWLP